MHRWPVIFLALLLLATCSPSGDPLERQAAKYDTVVWPKPPQEPRIRLLAMFGVPEDIGVGRSFFSIFWDWVAGEGPRHMIRPYAIAVNGQRIAVADPGTGSVHLYDLSRKTYKRLEWGNKEWLASPVGVTFVGELLYVADSAHSEIFVFDGDGDLLRTINGVERPTGLAWDPQMGRLYVVDTLNHSIVVMDEQGKKMFNFGGRGNAEGKFNYPSHITLAGDRVYVNDTMNFRIQIFDRDGNYISSFGRHGDGTGDFAQPKGLALDSEGHVYVVDALFNRLQIFDQQGRLLLVIGGDGSGPGEFWLPAGIFIVDDRIYVADSFNRRVQIFQFLGGA
jgi:DNA-binding beta-propeller fold protein YncE